MDLHLFRDQSHRRYNPLLREWVVVSPQRTPNPGTVVSKVSPPAASIYDPRCRLCPGNERAGGIRNRDYEGIAVFDDDAPALLPGSPELTIDEGSLIIVQGEPGICRQVAYSARHDLSFPLFTPAEARAVVDAWAEQYAALGETSGIRYVQIVERRGGHPHCDLWAGSSLPSQPFREQASFTGYYDARQTCMLCDYLALEQVYRERVVCENALFTALAPFWGAQRLETMVLSRRHATGLDLLNGEEREALAEVLRRLTARYDSLFRAPLPYTMGFHQRPTDGFPHREWHLHAHFYPLLPAESESAEAYGLLASRQRDSTPESDAARLRDAPEGEVAG
jgi:UDPglucose--hexose-1-phosphate uridylyltransferase